MQSDRAEIRVELLRRVLDMPPAQLVRLLAWLDAEGMEPIQEEVEKNRKSGVEPPHSIAQKFWVQTDHYGRTGRPSTGDEFSDCCRLKLRTAG